MKKVLSTLLSLLMILSLGTMNIAADEGTEIKIPVSYTVVDEKNSSDVKLEGNSPVKDVKSDVDVKTIVEDLTKDDSDVKSKLTDKQITAIKEGASTNIALVVSNTNANEDEKTTVNNVIEQHSLKSALMMDVDLLCTVTRNDIQIGDTQNITETKSEISVGVKVPDEYINTDGGINREYWVVRLHYSDTGVTTDVLPATFDSVTKMLTFKTNKFSLYAIAYKDTKVESEYVYIPSKNKKPVVNTAGYSFSPANIEISGNSGTTVLKVDGLPESNVLDIEYNPVLELKSADNKTVRADVKFVDKITENGNYTLNVKLQDTASKPALGKYEGTITVTIIDNEYEAKIGNDYYITLKKAIDEAENNDTVKIVKNVSLDEQLVIENKVLTLDLNGKTISENGAGVRKIRNEGILTITDSIGGGKICNTYVGEPGQDGSYGLIDNYGTLVIENGVFVDVAHGNGSSIRNRPGANLIINDGQFISFADDSQKQSNTYDGSANASVYSDGEKVEIKGGTFTMTKAMYTPAIKIMSGTGVVDGATISTYKSGGIEVGGDVTISNTNISVSETNSYYANALAVSNDGTINVNSGSFTGYSYGVYIYSSGGTVNINDGIFEAGTAVLKADKDEYAPFGSYINVCGGRFIGQYAIASDENTKLEIKGGTFSQDPTAYLASGYRAVDTEEQSYYVERDILAYMDNFEFYEIDDDGNKVGESLFATDFSDDVAEKFCPHHTEGNSNPNTHNAFVDTFTINDGIAVIYKNSAWSNFPVNNLEGATSSQIDTSKIYKLKYDIKIDPNYCRTTDSVLNTLTFNYGSWGASWASECLSFAIDELGNLGVYNSTPGVIGTKIADIDKDVFYTIETTFKPTGDNDVVTSTSIIINGQSVEINKFTISDFVGTTGNEFKGYCWDIYYPAN